MVQQDWMAKWALYSPQKIAVKEWETGRGLTYGDLNRLGNRLSRHLDDLGIRCGDRIAVLAENCLEYVLLFVAAQKTGVVLVPLNYRLTAAEIDYLLENSSPVMFLAEEKYQGLASGCKEVAQILHHWTIEGLRDFCNPTSTDPGDLSYPTVEVDEDHPVFILYTSGTTGFPKGALYSHKMLFWNSINTSMSLLVNSDSRTVNCMPPFHTGGWNVLTTPFLHHGGYVCLMRKFEAPDLLNALRAEAPTIFMGVPTMLKMVAECPEFGEADFSSLHYLIVGGEPMPVPLIETWHKKGVFVRQGFGMTEVGPNLTSLHHEDAIRKKGSIGRPNFYVTIRIAGPDGRDVLPGEAGELLLKGPMVTPGYWQNPEATAAAIRDGWFYSGDMVRMDEEGYVYVVDRIKNMFISGGENVYPAEVERVLNAHPLVSISAVIGVPDEKWGEAGKAFIVPVEGVTPDAADIEAYCYTKLARYKVPRYFVFLDALPIGATGKINRAALRQQ